MHTEVLSQLQNYAEEKYQKFSAKLLPQNIKLLGVRIPLLRQYAKILLKKGQGENYLNIPIKNLQYQEELMLYALILANIKSSEDEKIKRIKNFVPYINSWAVCDIFCAELKAVKRTPKLFYETFNSLVSSKHEYQIRFFYVLALNYFITDEFLPRIFEMIAKQKYEGYYDKMAVSWLLSVAYVKFPQKTEQFLFETKLDNFVFRKSISKICDSFRVTKEAKIHLRTLVSELKIKSES